MQFQMIAAVAAGGALGAVARYGVAQAALRAFGPGFPWGTLIVNVAGSFLMGLLIEYFARRGAVPAEMRAFLTVGVLGAFTTFSTFSLDFVTLADRKELTAAVLYAGASVSLAIAALVAGLAVARALA